MRTFKLSIISLGLVAGFASTASAQLQFDDVTAAPFAMVSNYGGFSWSNAFVISPVGYFGSAGAAGGFYTAQQSASHVMSNAGSAPLGISKAGGFNLAGGHFAATWTNGLTLNAKGYNNGTQIYSKTFNLNWSTAQYLNLDMYNVDNVVFTNSGGTVDRAFDPNSNNGFAFDDLDLSGSQQLVQDPPIGVDTVVPEPMTMSLVGFGLLAVGGIKSRRRRSAAK